MDTPYALNGELIGQEAIDDKLEKLIGETVLVSYTTVGDLMGKRRHFEPQISVQAELEGCKETGKYRVLVNDDIFAYFYNTSVWSMGQAKGKRAIIFIA